MDNNIVMLLAALGITAPIVLVAVLIHYGDQDNELGITRRQYARERRRSRMLAWFGTPDFDEPDWDPSDPGIVDADYYDDGYASRRRGSSRNRMYRSSTAPRSRGFGWLLFILLLGGVAVFGIGMTPSPSLSIQKQNQTAQLAPAVESLSAQDAQAIAEKAFQKAYPLRAAADSTLDGATLGTVFAGDALAGYLSGLRRLDALNCYWERRLVDHRFYGADIQSARKFQITLNLQEQAAMHCQDGRILREHDENTIIGVRLTFELRGTNWVITNASFLNDVLGETIP